MPTEKKTRDRTRERDKDKDKKVREKSSSDKYNDRKSSSRTKDSSKSTREKDRDKKKESKDKGDKREERERKKKKEENTKNHENESKSLKNHNNNEKRRSSLKQHRNEIVTDDSDISEDNIKQENMTTKIVIEDDFNYEDDEFEDYDEDFEEEEDDEEEEEDDEDDIGHTESKLDSGNYDVQPSRQASVRMQRELAAVKEAMVRENSGPKSSKQTSEMSDDSGRESPAARQTVREEPRKQSGFINFSAAKERNKVQIAAKAANSRGADLQKMIRLDIVNFDLLDLPPIRYRKQLFNRN